MSKAPGRSLTVIDGVAVVAGVVIGAGIFRAPSIVAGNVSGWEAFLLVWVAGGVVSLIGALCYAELATAYPDTGGDYHYLGRAFGGGLAFLFAWARLMVIQTGSIVVQAFLIGDYASEVLRVGGYSSAVYAALVVVLFTGLNVAGLTEGKWAQKILTAFTILGLLMVVAGGAYAYGTGAGGVESGAAEDGGATAGGGGALGLAMVFVLLTYGGWNEAVYLSAEVNGGRRAILKVLLWGIAVVVVVYLLVNVAFLAGLGMEGMANSNAVAADLMRKVMGEGGARLVSLLIVIAALSTVNATIITGARTHYALGRDFPLFSSLGQWQDRADAPVNALLVQGGIALALVFFGAVRRDGFTTMVEYTAPVFWFFFLLVGMSVIVLRRKEPEVERPYRVPFYPLTPLIFCGVCLYMLRASLAYTGLGALAGVAVLAAGVPLMLLARPRVRIGRGGTVALGVQGE